MGNEKTGAVLTAWKLHRLDCSDTGVCDKASSPDCYSGKVLSEYDMRKLGACPAGYEIDKELTSTNPKSIANTLMNDRRIFKMEK